MFLPLGTDEPIRRRKIPFINLTIVFLNIIIFLYEVYILIALGKAELHSFMMSYGAVPAAILHGQNFFIPFYLTPLTSMFLHGGLTHLGFNMLFLLAFGDNVEDRLGHIRYLFFYILCGFFACFSQILINPSSQIPSIGASGAIAGVLAGYITLFPTGLVRILFFFGPFLQVGRVPALFFILFWFLSQFFSGIASLGVRTAETGGIAYWAHIGGFAAGLIFALLMRKK